MHYSSNILLLIDIQCSIIDVLKLIFFAILNNAAVTSSVHKIADLSLEESPIREIIGSKRINFKASIIYCYTAFQKTFVSTSFSPQIRRVSFLPRIC